jgi:calcineurin-like phosphoesterase
VSAVVGTHTHVGTIDAKLFPRGTAHITDIGMVGPADSIIGDDTQTVLQRFLTVMPHRLAVGSGNKMIFNSVLINVDDKSGLAVSIERVDREVDL